MIDILPDLIEELAALECLGGRVYRKWPQGRVDIPYALIERMGRSVVLSDDLGAEVVVNVTYSVDILARSPSELDSIQSDVTDTLARYNIHETGESPLFESTNRTYRRTISYEGTVDRRGNTFTPS